MNGLEKITEFRGITNTIPKIWKQNVREWGNPKKARIKCERKENYKTRKTICCRVTRLQKRGGGRRGVGGKCARESSVMMVAIATLLRESGTYSELNLPCIFIDFPPLHFPAPQKLPLVYTWKLLHFIFNVIWSISHYSGDKIGFSYVFVVEGTERCLLRTSF